MKTSALEHFRQKIASDKPVIGLWVTLESASISEMAVALDLDWVVIDAEHGHLDWRDILSHIRATARSNTLALVRISELSEGLIKRALDIGADGIVVPWIETSEQVEFAMRHAKYPPVGRRGIGAERSTAWGQCFAESVANANEHVLVIPLVESVTGGQSLSSICRRKDVEIVFFGPADYSASAGHPGAWEGDGVAEAMVAHAKTVRDSGKHCGIMATGDADLQRRIAQGFRMLSVGADAGMLARSLGASLQSLGLPSQVRGDYESNSTSKVCRPLVKPPALVRPDRPETMNQVGSGPQIQLAEGVVFDCHVGTNNGARNLTTGYCTFSPGAMLPYHAHPCSESITLIRGEGAVFVDGRKYRLSPFDNVTVPRHLPHAAMNLSTSAVAVFQVALPTSSVVRLPADSPRAEYLMPDNSIGCPPNERVTRIASAKRFEAGPQTVFVDYFNVDLLPELEMSGGYAAFEPGGRLPAHYHEFDESISIVGGVATCVVEGRRYMLSYDATAMVPRGRIHYFINESQGPMAMIWVYAGPKPERIVVAESCATVEGNPWQPE